MTKTVRVNATFEVLRPNSVTNTCIRYERVPLFLSNIKVWIKWVQRCNLWVVMIFPMKENQSISFFIFCRPQNMGYIIYNNFVYKSTSPQVITYTIALLVIAYVVYQKIWPLVRRIIACGLKVAVNIHSLLKAYLLQAYLTLCGYRIGRRPLILRFEARTRRVSSKSRTDKLTRIREWQPLTSPLVESDRSVELHIDH